MTEDYLHYIWQFLKFNTTNLVTEENEVINIRYQGFHNHNSGPDFLESKIEIGETQWFGSVEIHIKSSDWNKHKHQHDPAYNNVILHVVYENDSEIFNANNERIPTLELKKLINHEVYFDYERFIQKNQQRPCGDQINKVPSFTIVNTLDEMLVERLMRKSAEIKEMLQHSNNDWEQVFHQLLFRYMGMVVNAGSMSELASRVPYHLLQKYAHDLVQSESLLFGQAGMLNEIGDNDYQNRLREEYLFLKQKHQLVSMKPENWKFSRMRPPNFPTLRIAQIASIYNSYKGLFGLIREKYSLRHLQTVFDAVPSDYWTLHYSFTSESKKHKGNLGKMALQNLVINVIVPFSFFYGRTIGDESFENYALTLLESLPSENNSIVGSFNQINLKAINAKDSQALIQLNNSYCKYKKCLSCKIGIYLLQ